LFQGCGHLIIKNLLRIEVYMHKEKCDVAFWLVDHDKITEVPKENMELLYQPLARSFQDLENERYYYPELE
jgi:hypothetical protein